MPQIDKVLSGVKPAPQTIPQTMSQTMPQTRKAAPHCCFALKSSARAIRLWAQNSSDKPSALAWRAGAFVSVGLALSLGAQAAAARIPYGVMSRIDEPLVQRRLLDPKDTGWSSPSVFPTSYVYYPSTVSPNPYVPRVEPYQTVSADGSTVIGRLSLATNGSMTGGAAGFIWKGDWQRDGFTKLFDEYGGPFLDEKSYFSYGRLVNGDGSVVVLEVYKPVGGTTRYYTYRWTADTGMVLITSQSNNDGMTAYAMNRAGDVIVGSSNGVNSDGVRRAYRWKLGQGLTNLGTLWAHPTAQSVAYATSADGKVVVGASMVQSSGNSLEKTWRPFIWVEGVGMRNLGTPGTGNDGFLGTDPKTPDGLAIAVSSDGKVVAGYSGYGTVANPLLGAGRYVSVGLRSFRWTEAGGMQDIGTLSTSTSASTTVSAMTPDGAVMVGETWTDILGTSPKSTAFRWTKETGLVSLGTLSINVAAGHNLSRAVVVSDDGKVIAGHNVHYALGVGGGTLNSYKHAFRWTKETGMVDLGVLAKDRPMQKSSDVISMSADGRVIVGWSQTDELTAGGAAYVEVAFIYKTRMQDLGALMTSYNWLANNTDTAVAQNQWRLGRLLDVDYPIAPGKKTFFSVTGAAMNAGASSKDDVGYQSQAGTLSLARALTPSFTLGVSAVAYGKNVNNANFKSDAGTAFALAADYVANPVSQSGLQFHAGLATGSEDNNITRGVGLNNVDWTTGTAELKTTALRLGLGYGFRSKTGWLFVPSVNVTQYNTSRSAYVATARDFEDKYSQLDTRATVANAGFSVSTQVGRNAALTVGSGAELDLQADNVVLTGTSDVPGLEKLSVASTVSRNKTRPYASVSYTYRLGPMASISTGARVAKSAFGNEPAVDVSLRYALSF